jgi:hypothetical protein
MDKCFLAISYLPIRLFPFLYLLFTQLEIDILPKLDVIKEVQDAIVTGELSINQAVIISQLSKNRQSKFLELGIAKSLLATLLFVVRTPD